MIIVIQDVTPYGLVEILQRFWRRVMPPSPRERLKEGSSGFSSEISVSIHHNTRPHIQEDNNLSN